MAIGTDSAVEFFGTQDTVTDGSTSLILDAAFSVADDISAWTNDDDAPMAAAVLFVDYALAPDGGSGITLFARLMNIDSTNDQDTPDANFLHRFMGVFPVNNVTTNQYSSIDIDLPNTVTSQVYEFYIQNNTGQSIQANWTLKMTPKTIGPHA